MQIQTLDAGCTVEDIAFAMERDGGCIVRNVIAGADLDKLDTELVPWIDQTPMGVEDWGGRLTKRTGALIARVPMSRPIAMHALVLGAATAFLGPFCERIRLNNTQLITLMPGQGAQPLHRDRLVWGGKGASGAGYLPRDIEPQFNAIWAVTDFTKENGATAVVPGSQKWDYDRTARGDEIQQAVMPRGSVFLYSGSVLHGGGTNLSNARRIAMNITYSLSWLRQEENQYISCPPEIAKDLDPDLTDLLGYTLGGFALGFCSDPAGGNQLSDVVSPDIAALKRAPREYVDIDGNLASSTG